MEEALSFFRAFEWLIYGILVVGGLFYIRKFILAWGELREAGFGLERENARTHLNTAATMLVLILALAVAEFVLVSFVVPSVPGATPTFTPTVSLLTTPTTTLPPGTPVPTSNIPVATLLSTQASVGSGCIPGQIMITSPKNGDEVSGVVEVTGTANLPNFGFYMFEIKRPDETKWATWQANNEVKVDGKLVDWDTRRLVPGEYQLGLVVADNDKHLSPPCIIQVRVAFTQTGTTSP